MKPRIDETAFGSITIGGTVFEHDGPDRVGVCRVEHASQPSLPTFHLLLEDNVRLVEAGLGSRAHLVVDLDH
jgi:hypothetical protein